MSARLFRKRCPWCKQWPVVETHDTSRWWVQCVDPDCPVQPVTTACETQEKAIKLWESRRP